ncbi:MAG: CoA pyrophosphatase [Bacteroidota bacterium]|nr:CoA pyrophosphatase [Bacteroidota bacterium]
MNFDKFLHLKSKLKEIELIGSKAHSLLAPPGRFEEIKDYFRSSSNPKKASVLIHIYPDLQKEARFVLIKRNRYEGIHSGQISLPGGKFQTLDSTDWNTAIREASEEVGLTKDMVVKIREITKVYIPPSNFIVSPFLSYSNEKPFFKPQKDEVDQIIETSLKTLLNPNSLIKRKISTSYIKDILVPGYFLEGVFVWGATAMILSEFRELFKKVSLK